MDDILRYFFFDLASKHRADRRLTECHAVNDLIDWSRKFLPDHFSVPPSAMHRWLGDRFGVIRNVELRENEGLYADFRFNPKHQIAEQLLWDAEHAPDNVGFSHNVEAIVKRDNDKAIVEKIVSVRSVDLVADPATTAGLFESEQSVTENIAVLELQSLREQILDELRNIVPELKRLLEERQPTTITESKPVSREQFVPEKEIDSKMFAKLITN